MLIYSWATFLSSAFVIRWVLRNFQNPYCTISELLYLSSRWLACKANMNSFEMHLNRVAFLTYQTRGGDIFIPPRVNLMASFLGWSKNFQLLMVFQVETSINFWWSQIFGLLWNLFQNWASKTPSRPDFRAKNVFFHFLSIFCITNHAFSSWIWILHKIIFLLRYITSL